MTANSPKNSIKSSRSIGKVIVFGEYTWHGIDDKVVGWSWMKKKMAQEVKEMDPRKVKHVIENWLEGSHPLLTLSVHTHTHIQRHTQTHIDIQWHRQPHKQTDSQTHRDTKKVIRDTHIQTHREPLMWKYTYSEAVIDRIIDSIDTHTRQRNRQRETNRNTQTHVPLSLTHTHTHKKRWDFSFQGHRNKGFFFERAE